MIIILNKKLKFYMIKLIIIFSEKVFKNSTQYFLRVLSTLESACKSVQYNKFKQN